MEEEKGLTFFGALESDVELLPVSSSSITPPLFDRRPENVHYTQGLSTIASIYFPQTPDSLLSFTRVTS